MSKYPHGCTKQAMRMFQELNVKSNMPVKSDIKKSDMSGVAFKE